VAEPVKLTTVERLILANQYRILETVCPDEAEYFAEAREVVEQGYEGYYFHLLRRIDDDVLTDQECKEVLEVMTMFSCLKDAYEALPDKSGIKPCDVRFAGFDGNYEGGRSAPPA
jgi:uncharacterized protein YfbU (UPF0304 family)